MKQESIEEKKARRKREAVCGVLGFGALMIVCAACVGCVCFADDVPKGLAIFFGVIAALCLLLIVPALFALKERFKEIDGGELDAASQY